MAEHDVLADIAAQIVSQNPDPVVRFRLLRDVLRVPATAPDRMQARQGLDASCWVQELAREQWDDGSWGRLHSQDSRAKQRTCTTEAGVERALALGLDAAHPILQRATVYLTSVLQGKIQCRDRAEKNDRWQTGVRLFAGATLAQIDPAHLALDDVFALWLEVAARTFAGGAYDADAEAQAHQELSGASVRNSYLLLDNKYALILLSARPAALSAELERTLVEWVWHRPDGIRYLGMPLARPPIALRRGAEPHHGRDTGAPSQKQAGRIEGWLASQELLSRFPAWRSVSQEAIAWLWQRRTAQGWWDLGARAAISTALPLSESWRKKGARALDWTTRVLTLLRRYAGGDPLRLALDDLQGAGETAELADVPELPAIPLIAQHEAGDLEVVLPELPRYIIRRMRMAHCKRGPELCEQCRQMNVEKISLLDISPPHPGEMQRRVIAVRHGGEQVWREFDIVRTFETEQEARQYATEHGIEDVEL